MENFHNGPAIPYLNVGFFTTWYGNRLDAKPTSSDSPYLMTNHTFHQTIFKHVDVLEFVIQKYLPTIHLRPYK
jgi:hypothetical protein